MVGSAAAVAEGQVLLGKYRVERTLGRGGMGVVLAARHVDLDELFAIKLMLPEIAANHEAVERFLREARAAAKLKGEHVARVQDVGRLPDGTPYMVLDYLDGADLRSVVRTRGPLPAAEATTYVLQACETLGEAHALGIVHRDVKPANIFLTQRRNGSPCVKVLDFGISKQTGADAVGLTMTATLGGSPLYMSPEQMRSAKYVDARTDIWSMGIVLYELLTGTTPFHADSITAVTWRVAQEEPVPPGRLRPGIPAALDTVILKCLAKRAEDRFATMEELTTAVRAAMASSTGAQPTVMDLQVPPDLRASFASVLQPAGQAGQSLAASPPSALRGGGRGPALSTTSGFGQASEAEAPPRPGPKKGWLAAGGAVVVLGIGAVAFTLLRMSGSPGSAGDPAMAGARPAAPPEAEVAPMPALTPSSGAPVDSGESPIAKPPEPDPGTQGSTRTAAAAPAAPKLVTTASAGPSAKPSASASSGAAGGGAIMDPWAGKASKADKIVDPWAKKPPRSP
jgi:serine/threonine protein kinase